MMTDAILRESAKESERGEERERERKPGDGRRWES